MVALDRGSFFSQAEIVRAEGPLDASLGGGGVTSFSEGGQASGGRVTSLGEGLVTTLCSVRGELLSVTGQGQSLSGGLL